LLFQSLSPITAAISDALPSSIAVIVALAVGYCRLRHRWQSQLPSSLPITIAIAVAIAVAHCQELLPWRGKASIQMM
jgi:hypothetical protein